MDLGEFQARKTAFEDIWKDFDTLEGKGDSGISPVGISMASSRSDSNVEHVQEGSGAVQKDGKSKGGSSGWKWALLTLLGLGAAAAIRYLVMYTDLLH